MKKLLILFLFSFCTVSFSSNSEIDSVNFLDANFDGPCSYWIETYNSQGQFTGWIHITDYHLGCTFE